MELPASLQRQIIKFLTALPINNKESQEAFIYSAVLDQALQRRMSVGGSTSQFFELLVPMLIRYGTLEDGRNALEAVLEAAKDFVGQEGRKECESLIQQIPAMSQQIEQQFNDFWNVFLGKVSPSNKIFVVLSAKWAFDWVNGVPTKSHGHTVQVTYREVRGFFDLQKKLDPTKFNFEIVHSDIDKRTETYLIPIEGKYYREGRLIVIGSTHANSLCKEIMDEVKPPYRFHADEESHKCIQIYQDENGELTDKPKSSIPDDNKLNRDYGIILRSANPFDTRNVERSEKRKVLILAGNHGFGTESAIRFVSNPECIQLLLDMVKESDFEVFFQANIHGQRVEELKIMRLSKWEGETWEPIRDKSGSIAWK